MEAKHSLQIYTVNVHTWNHKFVHEYMKSLHTIARMAVMDSVTAYMHEQSHTSAVFKTKYIRQKNDSIIALFNTGGAEIFKNLTLRTAA